MGEGLGQVRVGLSGWDYDGWRGDFYPERLPARARLGHVGERFETVELNGSFYSLQRPSSYLRWYDETPPGFTFALDPLQGVANFFASGPLALREKLGPVLWQLPGSLVFDEALIAGFLAAAPHDDRSG